MSGEMIRLTLVKSAMRQCEVLKDRINQAITDCRFIDELE